MSEAHSPVPRRFVNFVPLFSTLHLLGSKCFNDMGLDALDLVVCGLGAVHTSDFTNVFVLDVVFFAVLGLEEVAEFVFGGI